MKPFTLTSAPMDNLETSMNQKVHVFGMRDGARNPCKHEDNRNSTQVRTDIQIQKLRTVRQMYSSQANVLPVLPSSVEKMTVLSSFMEKRPSSC